MGRRKYPLHYHPEALAQVLRNNRNAPPYSECLAADANDGAELITFVFIAIHHLQHPCHQHFVDPHGGDLLRPLTPFDILVEDLIEDIVFREAIAILLTRPELGRRRFLEDMARDDLTIPVEVTGKRVYLSFIHIA